MLRRLVTLCFVFGRRVQIYLLTYLLTYLGAYKQTKTQSAYRFTVARSVAV